MKSEAVSADRNLVGIAKSGVGLAFLPQAREHESPQPGEKRVGREHLASGPIKAGILERLLQNRGFALFFLSFYDG